MVCEVKSDSRLNRTASINGPVPVGKAAKRIAACLYNKGISVKIKKTKMDVSAGNAKSFNQSWVKSSG